MAAQPRTRPTLYTLCSLRTPCTLCTLCTLCTWVDGGYLLGSAEGTFRSSLASDFQGGLCFGISLILGGLFFAREMRRHEVTTLIDRRVNVIGSVVAFGVSLPGATGLRPSRTLGSASGATAFGR